MDIEDFKTFQGYQTELADVLADTSEVAGSLKMPVEGELAELSDKVRRDTFKIMVTGTFKNGKSALINALLGEEILPSYALPCTAVINEIKYGEEKRAFLHFKRQLPENLPATLTPEAAAHLERHREGEVPPLEIPYDEIGRYAVIPIGADPEEMKLQTPFEKIELFHPLELLKNGVEIVDSPGLNEDELRTKVTMDYLRKVDAIIYVLNATAITAADEMRFVNDDLAGNDFDSVFFVVNKIDAIREQERDAIMKYAALKLSEAYVRAPLFGLSATMALEARQGGDGGLLDRSGIVAFEQRLTRFLTKEKGKAKLAQPAKRARYILGHEAQGRVIPSEYALLDASLQEVQRKFDLILPRLASLQEERTIKRNALSLKISRAGSHFERLAQGKADEIAAALKTWVGEFAPATKFGIFPTDARARKIVAEIAEHVQKKIADEHRLWRKSVLLPEIESSAADIFSAAEKDFGEIFGELDGIHVEIAGCDAIRHTPPAFWQRVVGVAGGLVIGDAGLAFSGGVNGIGRDFAKTVAFELGAGVALALLGLLNPFTIFAIFAVVVFGNRKASSDRAMRQIKDLFVETAFKSVKDAAPAQAQALGAGVVSRLEQVADQITRAVDSEIDQTKELLSRVRLEKERGEAEVSSRRATLADCERQVRTLNARLDALIFSLVEDH